MKIIITENKVIKSWCENPEEGALEQAKNLANLPFLFKQVCLMPDTHQGYGMPIGGVIATKGYVIPNAVGVDIGCGMCATKTSLEDISIDQLKKVMGLIREAVPVGFSHHKEQQMKPTELLKLIDISTHPDDPYCHIILQEIQSATYQVGTLGGGNHFIEIQKGNDGHMWIMIHSGSRNFGKKVADHHNEIAKECNEEWCSIVPSEHQLAFLPWHSEEGSNYVREMNACLAFAKLNRDTMMERVADILHKETGASGLWYVNIHHNYAAIENHYGENVIVHRKGATSAQKGQLGIIPGSQGTASYIVRGKGNQESFQSCSHGAGRKMGRKQAQRELDLEEEKAKLDAKGIVHSIRNTSDLDEASGAYKDIDIVMEEQKDLVDIEVKLEPLGVVKG